MPGLLVKFVTCTYEPPRAAGAPVATMGDPPAALLRFPPSANPEYLECCAGWSEQTRTGGNSQYVAVTWDIGREGRL